MKKKFLIVFIAVVAVVVAGCGITGPSTSGKPDSIRISMATPSTGPIAPGSAVQLIAISTAPNGDSENLTDLVTWSSSNPAVATISSTGLLTAISDGTTIITATWQNLSSTFLITIGGGVTLQSIAISPGNPSIAPGTTLPFVAQGTYSDGSVRNITGSVTWSSSVPAVATISASGIASAVTAGSTTITATFQSVHASTSLTVTSATLSSIAISPSNPSLAAGGMLQFHATATFSDGSTQDVTSVVTWISSTPATATINSSGLAAGVAPGSTTITAQYGSGPAASTTLTVTSATLVSITISPSNPSFHAGTTLQFTATAHYSDGTSRNITGSVTWSSSASGVVTIDANGLATAVAAGAATITATSGTTTATVSVTIQQSALNSISIAPSNPSVAPQTTQQFTATGSYADGTMQDITGSVVWSSSNTATATINSAGLASTLASGTSTISATAGSTTASTLLTVTTATVVSLAISPSNPTFAAGTTLQFMAIATYSDGSSQDVTSSVSWSSSSAAVSIDANGLATGNSPGSAQLTASYDGQSMNTTVTISNATVTSLNVGPSNPSIAAGTTQQFSATAYFSDGSHQDVTSQATWTSSSAAASINSSGLATAASVGTATITGSYNGQMSSTTLTVTQATLVSLSITPSNAMFAAGTTQQFDAVGTFSDGTMQDLTNMLAWTSGSNAIVSISSSGLATANSPGSTTITGASGMVSKTVNVTISSAAVSSISVMPPSASIANGTTQQFTAMASFTDGSMQNVTTQVMWTSSTSAASINANGLATGASVGSTVITAALGGQSNTANLNVTSAVLQSITITPASPTASAGNSLQLTATGNFSDGTMQDLTSTVNWTSSDSSTAQVSATGLVTTTKPGSVTITATDQNITKSVTFVVSAPVLTSVTVTPPNPSAPVGETLQLTATANYSDGSAVNVTNTATWASDTQSVATVNSTGNVTAVSMGTAGITATYQGFAGGVTFTSGAAALVSISFSPSNPSVVAGETLQLTATGTYSNGTMMDVTANSTWTTSASSIATVSGGLVSGVSPGMASITAADNGVTNFITVTVTGATVVSLAVTPQNPTAPMGTAEQFVATATYTDNSQKDVTSSATWTSSTSNVATVNSDGLATARSVGSSTIQAVYSGQSDSTTLTVSAATLTEIDVTPVATPQDIQPDVKNASAQKQGRFAAQSTASTSRSRAAYAAPRADGGGLINPVVPFNLNTILTTIAVGTEQQFTATGLFSDGSTHDLTPTATWSSTFTGIASVSQLGLASALSIGSTQIQATQSNLVGATTLNVSPAFLSALAIVPPNDTAYVGMNVQFISTATFSDGLPRTSPTPPSGLPPTPASPASPARADWHRCVPRHRDHHGHPGFDRGHHSAHRFACLAAFHRRAAAAQNDSARPDPAVHRHRNVFRRQHP